MQPLTNVDDGSALVEEGTVGVLGYALRGQEIDGVVRFAHEAVLRHRHLDVQYRHLHWTVSADSAPNDGPHVAVLCRSKKIIPLIQAALEQSGLSTLAVGASALLARPEIIDVLGVLRVVADHADSQALMRLLATPRFGLGARDLRRLARLAERLNTQYRYRALVQAGLGVPDADYQTQYAAVREHAQRVPNAVFVADVLMGDDADHLIDTSTLSDAGKRAAKHAGAVLRHVQRAAYEPIAHVIRAAVRRSISMWTCCSPPAFTPARRRTRRRCVLRSTRCSPPSTPLRRRSRSRRHPHCAGTWRGLTRWARLRTNSRWLPTCRSMWC